MEWLFRTEYIDDRVDLTALASGPVKSVDKSAKLDPAGLQFAMPVRHGHKHFPVISGDPVVNNWTIIRSTIGNQVTIISYLRRYPVVRLNYPVNQRLLGRLPLDPIRIKVKGYQDPNLLIR